jgi:hypothetical protein
MTATPERIVDIAIGFMGAKQLDAASRIGVFKALADGPKSVTELADATQHSERQVRTLADAMNALGLLERKDGAYSLEADAEKYLSGNGEIDLTPFIAFLGDISYKQWLGYDKTVDTDEAGTLDLDEAGWGDFMNGVMTYNALHAGEYFNIDGTLVYPIEQVEGWLAETGWKSDRLVALPGSPRVLVATAV